MKSRPWPIVIFGLIHILNPFYSFLFLLLLSQDTPILLLSKFQTSWQIIEFWGLYPIAGFAIWSMKSWSYPIILIVWIYNFYASYQSWSVYPHLVTLPLLAANYIVSLLVLAYFFIPNVRSVYFNPRLRWWERVPRFYFEWPCEILINEKKVDGLILDLAEGGAFIASAQDLFLKQNISICFQSDFGPFNFKAEIVHLGPGQRKGYGICFLDSTNEEVKRLRQFIESLEEKGIARRLVLGKDQSLLNWVKTLFTTGRGIIPDIKNKDKFT